MTDQAMGTVGHWLGWLFFFVLGLFGFVEAALRRLMDQLHIAGPLQTVILVLSTVVLIVLAVRVFGGLFRLLLMVFLVLLLVHVATRGSF